MIIKNNIPILVIRYSQMKNIDFIEEHNKIIGNLGYTWMLKTGKKITEKSLDNIKEIGGYIILKAPKADGGAFYIAKVLEYKNGMPENEYVYPEYYGDIVSDYIPEPLDGTWIKVERIYSLSMDKAKKLYLCSNNKNLMEVLTSTRTTVLHAFFDEEIEIN